MRKIVVCTLFLLAGCDLNVALDTFPTLGEDTGEPTEPTEPTEPAELDFPADVAISKISLYQGVEVVLREDNDAPPAGQPPVITNREALLRIFVDPEPGFEARRLAAHVTVSGGGNIEDLVFEPLRQRVEDASTDADLSSTFNFTIPAEDLRQPTEIIVELREANAQGPGEGLRRPNRFDSSRDLAAGLNAQQSDDLTVVIFPLRYNYDGSGRTPDTSDAAIATIRDLMQATYPAQNVTVQVQPPVDWNQRIRTGQEWENVLNATVATRERDRNKVAPNTYYYAMFDPDRNLYDYCFNGCLLGLSYLAFSADEPSLRASIGVGFSELDVAATTLAHEVGHAHGRAHAPCGDAKDIDPRFPHNGGSIGTWGYDPFNDQMQSPVTTADIMGYCSPIWVSDYTYTALFDRIERVADQARSVLHPVSTISVNGDGLATAGPTLNLPVARDRTPRVDVALYDETGTFVEWTKGWLHPLSHLPGGLVSLDRQLPDGWSAEVL
ncbi:MAG: hypothetical protein KTR31_07515 [Myxococcales bacterium]|nr:hypothetical protein [Myxococcales bacterium]